MKRTVKEELYLRTVKKNVSEDRNEIIGVEIRSRRKSQSQTLEAVCENICSQSYLCKLEKNKIEPNMAFVREICHRVELSEDKVQYLFDLREAIIKVLDAYVKGDNEFVREAYETGLGFENYRFAIIKLIYFLSIKDLDNATRVSDELIPIFNEMSDFDLTIFAIFSAILYFYKGEFRNALDNLEYLYEFKLLEGVVIIRDSLVFKLHLAMNMSDTPYYYEIVKKSYYENGYYQLIDNLKYHICLYYIKNKCDSSYNRIFNTINNVKLKTSIIAIKSFFDNDISKLINYDDALLNDFAKTLKFICIDQEKAVSLIENNESCCYELEYDSIFLKYFLCDLYKDKIDYIFKSGLPLAIGYNDDFLKKFFIDEIAKMPINLSRNRNLIKAYIMAYGGDFDKYDFGEYKYEI